MEAKLDKIHESESELSFTVTPDEYAESFSKEYKKELAKVSIPGFRKGKVPKQVVEKYYGDALKFQVAEHVATTIFYDYAEANDIKPVGTPTLTDFDYKPEQDLVFKIKYEHYPVLGEIRYKGFDIEAFEMKVTDEMIDREIEGLKADKVKKEPAEVIEGPDFSAKVELVRVDDGEGSEDSAPQTLDVNIGRSKPEIAAALNGKKAGDEFAFEFSDTHSHHHEGEGEVAHTVTYKYTGKVLEVSKLIYPEMTEEFIQEISNKEAKTVDEFREIIRKDYTTMFESQADRQVRQLLSSKLVEQNDFTVGKHQYEYYLNNLVEDEAKAQKEKGHAVSRETLKKRLADVAMRNIKLYHIEKAIVKAENITVADEKIEEIAKKEAAHLNYDYETILNIYKSNDNLKDSLLQDALYDFLKANNNVTKTDKQPVPQAHDHE